MHVGSNDGVSVTMFVAVLIGVSVAVAVISFLLGLCVHYTCSRCHRSYKKKRQPPADPYYDHIVLNPIAVTRSRDTLTSTASDAINTTPNEAYNVVPQTL